MKKLIDCLKVGDKVFDVRYGWGTVQMLHSDSFTRRIDVLFEHLDNLVDYLPDGRINEKSLYPSLFLEEIKLEQKLPEFIEGDIVFTMRDGCWTLSKFNRIENGYYITNFIPCGVEWKVSKNEIKHISEIIK